MEEQQKKYQEVIDDIVDLQDCHDIELSIIDSFLINMLVLCNFERVIDKYNHTIDSLEDFEFFLDDYGAIYYLSYYSFYDSLINEKSSITKFSMSDLINIIDCYESDGNYTKPIIDSCSESFDKFNFKIGEKCFTMSAYMCMYMSYLWKKLYELYLLLRTNHLKSKLDNKEVHRKKKIREEYSWYIKELFDFKNQILEYEYNIEVINIWENINYVKGFTKALKDILNTKFDSIIHALSQKVEFKDFCKDLCTPYEIVIDYVYDNMNKKQI